MVRSCFGTPQHDVVLLPLLVHQPERVDFEIGLNKNSKAIEMAVQMKEIP